MGPDFAWVDSQPLQRGRLLGLILGAGCPLPLTDDLALKLVSGSRHVIQLLTFNVVSIEWTRAFRASECLLGTSQPDELTLDPQATVGLKLKFREAKSLCPPRAADNPTND